MNMLDVFIDNKKYEYVDSIKYNDKTYIAYKDDKQIYISEYELIDEELSLLPIDDKMFETVRKEMNL